MESINSTFTFRKHYRWALKFWSCQLGLGCRAIPPETARVSVVTPTDLAEIFDLKNEWMIDLPLLYKSEIAKVNKQSTEATRV